jgi:hypothetical protein
MVESFLQAIGGLVVGSGLIVAFTYWVFRLLASKWLETKFQERLEAFKHVQAKEIEELRFRINSMFDRVTQLH